MIRPDLLDDRLRERFLAEARAMARVSHANVLPIYAFGEHEGAPYFVTQIVRGQTVESWIDKQRKGIAPDIEVAFKILEETCRGVIAIHDADTVHRDLKPSNLLLDSSFTVRIADMGVAALLWSENGIERQEIVGTPEYMAPEIVLQHKIPLELARRADVYALGCLAFELFTGTAPFPATSVVAKMMAHVNNPLPRPSARRPDLLPEIGELVLRRLPDPAQRTGSASVRPRRGAVAHEGPREDSRRGQRRRLS